MLKLKKEYIRVNETKNTIFYGVTFEYDENGACFVSEEETKIQQYLLEELPHMEIEFDTFGEEENKDIMYISIEKEKGSVTMQRKEIEKAISWFVKKTNKFYK